MKNHLIICRSITHAQRVSRLLQRRGIWNQIVRIPVGLVNSGCGYAVKVRNYTIMPALEYLKEEKVPYVALFVEEEKGYREVHYDLL